MQQNMLAATHSESRRLGVDAAEQEVMEMQSFRPLCDMTRLSQQSQLPRRWRPMRLQLCRASSQQSRNRSNPRRQSSVSRRTIRGAPSHASSARGSMNAMEMQCDRANRGRNTRTIEMPCLEASLQRGRWRSQRRQLARGSQAIVYFTASRYAVRTQSCKYNASNA